MTAANDAALGLLVGDRIARADLSALASADSEKRLSELYSAAEVEDISRFDFRVPQAQAKLLGAERELCVMAVPFAVSLYNEYLVTVSELLELAHIARPPQDAQQMMLGKLERYLSDNGVSVGGDWAALLRLIQAVRNKIIHAGAAPGDAVISKWEKLSPGAKQAWEKVTGRPMPFAGPNQRLPWAGPEIRGVFLVIRQGLNRINEALQGVLPREFWADLLVHELWVDSHRKARASRSGKFLTNSAKARGYGSLKFEVSELREAVGRAPFTGWTPDLRPYWQRSLASTAPLTKAVTSNDLAKGHIRIPDSSKGLFPQTKQTIQLKIREVDLACSYNPQPEAGRPRSGVVYLGGRMRDLVVAGQELSIFRVSQSEVGLQ